ncbi:hypothetical protein BC351_30630 [Paenibacillus ferrarius]|uniref:Secreted protein n=1 Tax=Paenibacillus ferrarius TaxID=1469647 RepID=A0A1V4HGI8_9BACL|nr:hypothetical protein BC351_30630 [Paenibacillus ferrarius]
MDAFLLLRLLFWQARLAFASIQPASWVETAFSAGSAPGGCFSPAETAFLAGSACFYRDPACFAGRNCLFGWLSAGWMFFLLLRLLFWQAQLAFATIQPASPKQNRKRKIPLSEVNRSA